MGQLRYKRYDSHGDAWTVRLENGRNGRVYTVCHNGRNVGRFDNASPAYALLNARAKKI